MVEFAESVLYMPLRGDLLDKRRSKIELEPRFMDGIFIGLTDRSDEIIVFGSEGFARLEHCAGAQRRKGGAQMKLSM